MISTTPDPRIDRLYQLLPAIYRMRDGERSYPLEALLRVIAEQVNVVEDDIGRLYENWFIETCEDWTVPYIADLIGYRPVREAGQARDGARQLNRILTPRREVANTIRYRRRKGTLALLELLAADVAGWPALAVEFFKRLGWNQNINHQHLDRARTADLRRVEELDLIDGPFDPLAHTVDVCRIISRRTVGRYNIPSVGVFIWRLKAYPVTRTPAYCAETEGPQCYTFSVLGQDAPLFRKPEPEADPAHIAEEANVPAPIRRLAFERHKDLFYGTEKSLAIWTDGWAGYDTDQPLPLSAIVAADLSDWQYAPKMKHVAVDPVLGRIAFPPSQLPKKGVRVSYHYGFSADMGGGEYSRPISDPSKRTPEAADPTIYRVGKGYHPKLIDAVNEWKQAEPLDAVIEIAESAVFVEALHLRLKSDQTLQIRAANRTRPILRLIDWQTDLPDALSVFMGEGSRFVLDGLMVTGRPVHITGPDREQQGSTIAPVCGSEVVIRHCTLVPGWAIECDCEPSRPAEPSLELFNVRAKVAIEHSIVGSIAIHEDEVKIDPIPLRISDSIIDSTDPDKEAIGSPGYAVAHTVLTIHRSTVYGIVDVHAIEIAGDCIFCNCVNVARRQLGCMRFCYVPSGCRTPRRYHCQPDLVEQAAKETVEDEDAQAREIQCERLRVCPQFTSSRYGNPGYAQLGLTCAVEIKRGAEDESEMGAFHDLYQPQREANLRARLDEFTPAGMDAGILFVT